GTAWPPPCRPGVLVYVACPSLLGETSSSRSVRGRGCWVGRWGSTGRMEGGRAGVRRGAGAQALAGAGSFGAAAGPAAGGAPEADARRREGRGRAAYATAAMMITPWTAGRMVDGRLSWLNSVNSA